MLTCSPSNALVLSRLWVRWPLSSRRIRDWLHFPILDDCPSSAWSCRRWIDPIALVSLVPSTRVLLGGLWILHHRNHHSDHYPPPKCGLCWSYLPRYCKWLVCICNHSLHFWSRSPQFERFDGYNLHLPTELRRYLRGRIHLRFP